MRLLGGRFENPSLPKSPRAERRPASGFSAYHWTGWTVKQHDIKNLSATGVYLLTEERWHPGQLVSLTLQSRNPLGKFSKRPITLKAKAVRWGEDGVGLAFVLPEGPDPHLWERLEESTADQAQPGDIQGLVRRAEALAFLSRICPSGQNEVRQLFRGGLNSQRVVSAVEIALEAENLLTPVPDGERMRAHSRLVVRILEDGSRAEEDWVQQLWAGLLASSCTIGGNDESNLVYIDLLTLLADVHVRIFINSCTRATKFVSETGLISAQPLICKMNEIVKITDAHQILRIERDLEHLAHLGLTERTIRPPSFLPLEEANITPTTLGLELYARCSGHRGAPQEFYGVVAPDAIGS